MQLDNRLPVAVPGGVLDQSGHLAGFDRQVLTRHRFLGNHGLDLVGDALHTPTHRGSDHGHRFGQAHVPDLQFGGPFTKLVRGEAGTNFLLEGQAADGGVLDPVHSDGIDPLTRPSQDDGQGVHGVSGVHPGPDHS